MNRKKEQIPSSDVKRSSTPRGIIFVTSSASSHLSHPSRFQFSPPREDDSFTRSTKKTVRAPRFEDLEQAGFRGTTATRLANPWTMKDSAAFNRCSRVPFVAPFRSCSISRRGVRGAVDPQEPITHPFRFNAIRGRRFDVRFDPSTGSLLFLAIHASDTTRGITVSVDTLDIYIFTSTNISRKIKKYFMYV